MVRVKFRVGMNVSQCNDGNMTVCVHVWLTEACYFKDSTIISKYVSTLAVISPAVHLNLNMLTPIRCSVFSVWVWAGIKEHQHCVLYVFCGTYFHWLLSRPHRIRDKRHGKTCAIHLYGHTLTANQNLDFDFKSWSWHRWWLNIILKSLYVCLRLKSKVGTNKDKTS